MGAATAGRPAGFESWFAEEGAGQVEIDDRADDAQQAIEKAAEEPAFVQDDALSIGAINAAIIAGNAPPKRVERLRAFWEGITAPSSLWPALSSAITGQSRRASSHALGTRAGRRANDVARLAMACPDAARGRKSVV